MKTKKKYKKRFSLLRIGGSHSFEYKIRTTIHALNMRLRLRTTVLIANPFCLLKFLNFSTTQQELEKIDHQTSASTNKKQLKKDESRNNAEKRRYRRQRAFQRLQERRERRRLFPRQDEGEDSAASDPTAVGSRTLFNRG
jgi:hypothetical protein